MRSIRRGPSPINGDFKNYRDAFPHLAQKLGLYCSYCERRIATGLAVEHIQPKALPAYKHLVGNWQNFLLACINCNASKGDTDVVLANHLIPDRDNTSSAFLYLADGRIEVSERLAPQAKVQAQATLTLVALDRRSAEARNPNERLVALDRFKQRIDAWLQAEQAKQRLAPQPDNEALIATVIDLALATGFFSIWMQVFADDVPMRRRLIQAFGGTLDSGCFDPQTTQPMHPAPNPDRLPDGGKA